MKDDEYNSVVQSDEIEAPKVGLGIHTGEDHDMEFVESDEEGAALGSAQKVKDLKQKIAVLQKEKQEYLDGWQRSRADYANLQKTTDEDRKRMRGLIEENFIEDLLPVIDSFSMAMSNKEAWEKVDANWRTGVEYIYQQMMTVLKDRGFATFGAAGETFDPTLHEAVSETETDDEKLNHTIAAVLQQGYKLGDNILRAARVSVYTKK
ncbi:MAG: nucleotide exchange factor GrpE [Candidatus Nomurabacteria bacterium]|nr:nucleotide exchange factor GrpE [Candidatus Nomurabacteria bacterium]